MSHRSRLTVPLITAALAAGAMLAVWSGPAAMAGPSAAASAQGRAVVSAFPKKVKYYIIPKSRKGGAQSLFAIAQKTLGNGSRFTEIFDLNKGQLQPGGGRLRSPQVVQVGWVLQLPADASGPGVHFGRMPRPVTKTAPAPQQSPQPTAAPSATAVPEFTGGGNSAMLPILAGSALLVLTAVGLVTGRRRRGVSDAFSRRKPSHAKGASDRHRAAPATLGIADGSGPDLSSPGHSWPGTPGSTTWLSWDPPGQPVQPGGLGQPGGAGGPAAPQRGPQRRTRVGAPAGGPAPAGGGPGGGHLAAPLATRAGPAPSSRPGPEPGGPQRWPGQPAPGAWPGQAPGMPGHGRGPGLATAPRGQDPYGRDLQVVLNSTPTATRPRPQSLIDTNQENFKLSADEAAALWAQPPAPGGAIQVSPQQEAAEIRRQATAQATAIRSTAEREAEQLRSATMTMSTELLRVARYVTENLSSVVFPEAQPAVRPGTRPQRQLTEGPARAAETAALTAAPATAPATTPGRPGTRRPGPATDRPARKTPGRPGTTTTTRPAALPSPNTKGRQVGNWHKAVVSLVVFGLIGAASGGTEIALHGFKFFEFRNTGAGAGNSQDLEENQGPGQPDAPGTHHPRKAPPKAKEHPKKKHHHHPGNPGRSN